jgi:NADPH:quinone reductase-like Zn-dependent oxidoreductase
MNRDDLTTLCALIKAGKLTPVIDRRYSLAESASAIAYVEEGHNRRVDRQVTTAASRNRLQFRRALHRRKLF